MAHLEQFYIGTEKIGASTPPRLQKVNTYFYVLNLNLSWTNPEEEEIRLSPHIHDPSTAGPPIENINLTFDFSLFLVPCCQTCQPSSCHRPQTMTRQPDFSPAGLSELVSEQNPTRHRSAWGGNLVEYSTSGSTAEVVDFQPSRHPREITNFSMGLDRPLAWHPKLTLYRLLVIFSTIGLGAAKAATSYLNLTYASITLEWVLSVAVFLGWVYCVYLRFHGSFPQITFPRRIWRGSYPSNVVVLQSRFSRLCMGLPPYLRSYPQTLLHNWGG